MKSYHLDLRERLLAARRQGHRAAELAQLFAISPRTIQRYCRLQEQTGSLHAKPRGGYRRSRLAAHDATLQAWIAQTPDLSLAQLQTRLREECHLTIGTTALWQRLEHLGLSDKKKPCAPPSKIGQSLNWNASSGGPNSRRGPAPSWFFLMKPGSTPR